MFIMISISFDGISICIILCFKCEQAYTNRRPAAHQMNTKKSEFSCETHTHRVDRECMHKFCQKTDLAKMRA